jgi:hypothetical protein
MNRLSNAGRTGKIGPGFRHLNEPEIKGGTPELAEAGCKLHGLNDFENYFAAAAYSRSEIIGFTFSIQTFNIEWMPLSSRAQQYIPKSFLSTKC